MAIITIIVQFSRSVVSDSLHPHGLHMPGFPVPSILKLMSTDLVMPSRWHPDGYLILCRPLLPPSIFLIQITIQMVISSSVILFSCLQSFSASGHFQMSQFFASGGQSIGVSSSASVLPMNIQD